MNKNNFTLLLFTIYNVKIIDFYIRLGTFGAMIEYGIERRITPNSNLGATMIIGVPFGVTLRVKFTRATQTYTFPIHLADEVSFVPLFNIISFIKIL